MPLSKYLYDQLLFVALVTCSAVALYVLYRKLGWRGFALMLLGLILCVLLADRISSGIFKPLFARPRPTHALGDAVHVVREYRGGAYGFVSSHAANLFAIAVYTLLLVRRRWFTWVMLIFAVFVSYTRIYLGVHYPLDIACGALLGALIGWVLAKLFYRVQKKFGQYLNG